MSHLSSRFVARLSFLTIVVSLAAIPLVMMGCTATTSTVTTAQATSAAQTIGGSFLLVMAHQNGWTPAPPYTTTTAVSYSTAGLNMTGTVTILGSTTTYSLTVTLSSYTDAATGYTVKGTFNFSQTGTTTSQSGTVTGNVSLSGGPVTNMTWNASFTSSGGPPTFAGTIICNGTSFDANTVVAGTVQAQTAMEAAANAIATAIGNQPNWIISGTTVTYNSTTTPAAPAGLSVSGTLTVSGTTSTYALTITLSNYAAGGTGYTVSGTITWSVVVSTTPPATYTSGTVSANLTLSGGPITTETWNLTSVSGITAAATFSGIITINGTTFDGKII